MVGPILGSVARGFEGVADAFAGNVAAGREVGAACCVYLDGEVVVDLWYGDRSEVGSIPWFADTPVPVFSLTKGATAICVLQLIENGTLGVDTPVRDLWPEFGAEGKSHITVGSVMSHRAGIPAIDRAVTLRDLAEWSGVAAAVAAQRPEWPPNSAHGYHARSWGWVLGEVIRRTTGISPGTYFAQRIAAPLDLDFWIGLPLEVLPRVATLVTPDGPLPGSVEPASLEHRVSTGPSGLFAYDDRWNRLDYLAPEVPSSNGVASARAVARMYAATVGEVAGLRLLTPETVDLGRTVRSDGLDRVTLLPSTFGLGFALPPTLNPQAPAGTFGHPGAGGSLGFADPAAKLGFGYVTNRLELSTQHVRAAALVGALYAALGRPA